MVKTEQAEPEEKKNVFKVKTEQAEPKVKTEDAITHEEWQQAAFEVDAEDSVFVLARVS